MWPQLWSWRELNWYNVDFNNTALTWIWFYLVLTIENSKSDFWNQIFQAFVTLTSWNPQIHTTQRYFFPNKTSFHIDFIYQFIHLRTFFFKICSFFCQLLPNSASHTLGRLVYEVKCLCSWGQESGGEARTSFRGPWVRVATPTSFSIFDYDMKSLWRMNLVVISSQVSKWQVLIVGTLVF